MAATADTSFTGQTIQHYQVKERLKRRPASSLYLAQDTRTDQLVFIEILHTTITGNEALAGRFQRRMETISQLKHPNIAPILTVAYTSEKYPFAVIKHVPGTFLSDKLAQWQQTNSMPDAQTALALIRHLVSALTAAHPVGIIHHDLRPDNIYMQANDIPIFLDLGVTISPLPFDETILEKTGTLDYAPPEQLRGQALTGRSNIFSLGIILYELLGKRRPKLPISDWDIFDRRVLPKEIPLEEVRKDLAQETYALVKNCLWQQEWNRYDTAQEMLAAIDGALEAEKRWETAVSHHHHPVKNNKWRLIGLIAGGILLLILIILAIILLT
ncbi:MAG: serine/threonine-protein kinase [Chloroflexota bacterium]|nr:serine/threonine protein kinase [Ardenticatenaceae bacterium]